MICVFNVEVEAEGAATKNAFHKGKAFFRVAGSRVELETSGL